MFEYNMMQIQRVPCAYVITTCHSVRLGKYLDDEVRQLYQEPVHGHEYASVHDRYEYITEALDVLKCVLVHV